MYGFCRNTDLSISHFIFFKQKINLKSIYMLWKSCSSSYTEHNKIRFAIFGFFCDLLWILQVAGKTLKRVRNLFASRPLDSFPPSQIYPRIAQNTLEVSGASQCGPRAKGRCGQPKSDDLAGGPGRGRGWEGSRGRERPTCGSSLGRKAAGQGECRGLAVPAAATRGHRRGDSLGDPDVARGFQ
jgi:hypothetical protein